MDVVAGIFLDDFVAAAAMIDDDMNIAGSIHFKRHLDVADLVIENLLNGHDVNNIVQNGLRKTNPDILELSKLTVHGNVTFEVKINILFLFLHDYVYIFASLRTRSTRTLSTAMMSTSIWAKW